MSVVKDPAQTFCSCGQPLILWNVPPGHVALPIEWEEKACDKCRQKKQNKSLLAHEEGNE
jgi:hypothetical protein